VLEWLRAIGTSEEIPSVLDVGCGAGLLTIAAVKELNATVLASDIKEAAVQQTMKNVYENGMSEKVTVVQSDGLQHPYIRQNRPYDIIIANILADTLLPWAHDFYASLKPGGLLILSGIQQWQLHDFQIAYAQVGFHAFPPLELDQWCSLGLTRDSDDEATVRH
jgi:ribosomal protein L11 methyltransferase